MDKKEALQQITKDMERDKTLPLVTKPQDVIPGDGNSEAEIVLIGEAGGYYESLQRKPFVGAAGQLLNKLLASIKLDRKDVYITNMVKTRPPNNRDPLPEELAIFAKYLDRELDIIKPKIILTLGRFSMGKFLPGVKISAVHGKIYKVKLGEREVTVIPMFHPAAALRQGLVMQQIKTDFLKLPEIIKTIKAEKPKIKVEQISLC